MSFIERNLKVLLGAVGVVGLILLWVFRRKGSKSKTALNPDPKTPPEYKSYKLIEKVKLSREGAVCNTYRFRFALPRKSMTLGLPLGKHINLRLGKQVRPYTPVSSEDDKGYFDLVVKIYKTGKLTPLLENLKEGENAEMRGPFGRLLYLGNSLWEYSKEGKKPIQRKANKVGMIAGGSGITPMYQIMSAILKDNKDQTKISMIFGNVSEDDMLLRPELLKLEKENKTSLSIFWLLDKAPSGWVEGASNRAAGYCSPELVQKHLPGPGDDTLILMCGPPRMIEGVTNHLNQLNYPDYMYFDF